MKHNDQSSLGREGFVLDFHISVVRTGTKQKQSRNLEAEEEAVKVLALYSLLTVFSYRS